MGILPCSCTLRGEVTGLSYGYSEHPFFHGKLRLGHFKLSSSRHCLQKSRCPSAVNWRLITEGVSAAPVGRISSAASIACVLHQDNLLETEDPMVASTVSAVTPVAQSTYIVGHENSSQTTLQEIRGTVKKPTSSSSQRHTEGIQVSVHGRKIWCKSSSAVRKGTLVPQGKFISFQDDQQVLQPDHLINIDELLESLKRISTEEELCEVMADWKGKLSLRLMVLVLNRERDWQRALALHDWMIEKGGYRPSIYAYNIVLRNILRARRWTLGEGLVSEMQAKHISPDKFTYSTLISHFSKAGKFESALKWLQQMEQDGISADLITYSTLIELARKLKDYSKAIALFSKLKAANLRPDLILYNSMINVLGKAKLFREAKDLLCEMKDKGVTPDTVSYSTLLNAYVENDKFVEALSVFSEMKSVGCAVDLTTCNIMIDVYGQLEMVKEAESLFWSMRKIGIFPNVVTYNTMLKVHGEAELFGEAIHLFRLMQKKDIEQNVITYNTMIKIYGKTLEHEKATNLVKEMREKGIEPNAITYSTLISIYGKVGKYERAALLFQKLRSSGIQIDEILYQCMIVLYERAGLVGHAKRLLHELKQPNDVPRETAISILAKAGKMEEAAWLFRKAFDAGEVKDIAVFECMINLFVKNKKYSNAVEVYEKMREIGRFPGSETIITIITAYQKLQLFNKADNFYHEMQEEGCVFADEVHFQMMNLYAAKGDLQAVVSLFEKLELDANINQKELCLVLASIYERANRLDDASRVIMRIKARDNI